MRRDQRQAEHEFHQKVTIAACVQTVCSHGIEAQQFRREISFDRQRGAGQGGRSERTDVDTLATIRQSFTIALKFFNVGQPVMCCQHRLRSLQVRVTWQHDIGILIASYEERFLDRSE